MDATQDFSPVLMLKLAGCILFSFLIFKLALIVQMGLGKLSLFTWLVRTDFLAVEKFRREIIDGVKIVICDLWRSSLSDFTDEDEDVASVVSEIPWEWMEKEMLTDDNNNEWDLYCQEPPKEEIPPDNTNYNVLGGRRTSARRRNAVVLMP